MPRLLIINPNISDSVSALIDAEARRAATLGTDIETRTAPFGVAYIETQSESAIGGHAVLEMVAEAGSAYDAIVVAAFGDPGLAAAREIAPCPVVGIAEAAITIACNEPGPFAVIAISARIKPWYLDCIRENGAEDRLIGVRTLTSPLRDIAAIQQDFSAPLLEMCETAVEDGAKSIILAGAPLSGLRHAIADKVDALLIDGVSAGVARAEAMIAAGRTPRTDGQYIAPVHKPHRGLSPALAAMFGGDATLKTATAEP